jgi:hypothetical protein
MDMTTDDRVFLLGMWVSQKSVTPSNKAGFVILHENGRFFLIITADDGSHYSIEVGKF